MTMGNFDPAQVTSIMSPFTEQVVGATQNWFNNQNAIQANNLLSQAIRSGNAFGGDRAGVAEAQLAGQQQLAQAPVIAGLRQAGYTQALDEYNRLKQFGLAGAQAAWGFGTQEQQQVQRELDVAQQNAMMASAYPFQTANWYGSILGGLGPLLGSQVSGFNTPPAPNALSTGLGLGLGVAGLAAGFAGAGDTSGAAAPAVDTSGQIRSAGGVIYPRARGGLIQLPGMARGGLVGEPIILRRQDGGGTFQGGYPLPPSDQQDTSIRRARPFAEPDDQDDLGRASDMAERVRDDGERDVPNLTGGHLRLSPQLLPQPVFPGGPSSGTTQPQQGKDQTSQLISAGATVAKLLPLILAKRGGYIGRLATGGGSRKSLFSDVPNIFGQLELPARSLPQPTFPSGGGGSALAPHSPLQALTAGLPAIGKLMGGKSSSSSSGGEPIQVGESVDIPAAARGGYIRLLQRGGDVDDDDEPLTMTDIGVLSPGGRELPPSIAGPPRGSPAGPVQQAADVPNLARVRERFRPALERNPALARQFDINTTAEAGERMPARDFYQALTLDRAAARGEALPYTLSRGPGTPDRYYPWRTIAATRTSGFGVNPALWAGANPARFATGNASYDPNTGRYVGFAGGPQTGSVQTGGGTEYGGVEGPDVAAARRYGYTGPSRTAIGPSGPQGAGDQAAMRAADVDRATTGPSGGPSGGGGRPLAPGETRTYPALARTERPMTFGQRWASSPLTQLAIGLLGRSPYFGVNLASGLQNMTSGQIGEQALQRQKLLDEKPELITLPSGEQAVRHSNGQITNLGLGVLPEERRAQEEHAQKMAKPITVKGLWGDEEWVYDPKQDRYVPLPAPQQTKTEPPPKTEEAPAQPPAQPPAPAPTPAPPQVRQTWEPGATTDPRITAQPFHTPATLPPSMQALVPAAPAAPAAPATTAQVGPTTRPPPAPADTEGLTDEQKDIAAQVRARGGFKTPLNVDPRMMQYFSMTPEQFDFRAARLAMGDTSVLTGAGMGRQASALKSALRSRADQYWMDRGLGPERANAAVNEFLAQKAGARSLATQEARITGALKTAMQTAPRVIEASNKVDRTQFPDLNKIIIMARQKTGDPNVVQFGSAIETFIRNYARAMGGGNNVLTDESMRRMSVLLQDRFSKGQINAAIDQALVEMDSELTGIRGSMGSYLGTEPEVRYQRGDVFRGGPGAQPAAPTQQAPRPRVRQGGHVFERQPDGTMKFIE